MNYWNDKVLRDSIANYVTRFKKIGIGDKIKELEDRIEALENRRVGRPRKVNENV